MSSMTVAIEGRQMHRAARHVARHARRLAEQRFHFHVDRLLPKWRSVTRQVAVGGRLADHGERAALALADRLKLGEPLGRDRQHVAFLRLVAPDFGGRHARLFDLHLAQLESARRAPRRWASSGRALERPPAPTSWTDRIGLSSPSCQQRSMTSCARRWISGLPRCTEAKSRSSVLLPVVIDRSRAAAETDQHAGATELDQQRAGRKRSALNDCCA